MVTTTQIKEVAVFDRGTTGLMSGGLLAGGVTIALTTAFGVEDARLGALCFGALVGLALYVSDDDEDEALISLLLSLGGGVVMAAGMGAGVTLAEWAGVVLGGALVALGAGVRGFSRLRSIVWALLGGLGLLLGYVVSIDLVSPLAGWWMGSEFVAPLMTSGIWGLFVAGVVGVAHVEVERDSVRARLKRAAERGPKVLRQPMQSALRAYEQISVEIAAPAASGMADRARRVRHEASEAALRLNARYAELTDEASQAAGELLQEHVNDLDSRIESTQHAELAEALLETRAQLLEQVALCGERELVLAQLECRAQRCITLLEQLNMTLIQNSSGELEQAVVDEVFEELEYLAQGVQVASFEDHLGGPRRGEATVQAEALVDSDCVDVVRVEADDDPKGSAVTGQKREVAAALKSRAEAPSS